MLKNKKVDDVDFKRQIFLKKCYGKRENDRRQFFNVSNIVEFEIAANDIEFFYPYGENKEIDKSKYHIKITTGNGNKSFSFWIKEDFNNCDEAEEWVKNNLGDIISV